MRTILIATDFSEAARNATYYGLKLSIAFHAQVILCNIFKQVSVPEGDSSMYAIADDIKKLAEMHMQNEVEELHLVAALPVKTYSVNGTPAKSLLAKAQETNADLIVMGMKASHHTLRTVFGSTVSAVVKNSTIPVLIIPEEVKYNDPRIIALANDSKLETEKNFLQLDWLRCITERFQSKLLVVRVVKDVLDESTEAFNSIVKNKSILPTFDTEYKYVKSTGLQDALNDFIRLHRVEILVMLPHRHSLIAKWFYKSATRSMIFQTHIPLLILPEVNNYMRKTPESEKRKYEAGNGYMVD
ncbi:MAG TPA: universal stress protein [Puia sp.]|nr:universal stress protein [Puia sp.]